MTADERLDSRSVRDRAERDATDLEHAERREDDLRADSIRAWGIVRDLREQLAAVTAEHDALRAQLAALARHTDAARREGAEAMRERAARQAEKRRSETGDDIADEIRAIPLDAPEGER